MNLTLSVTGHRPKDLFGYDGAENYKTLANRIYFTLVLFYNMGVRTFISGGAQGADQIFFWSVNALKKKYGDVRNIVYVPYRGQELKWGTKIGKTYTNKNGESYQFECLGIRNWETYYKFPGNNGKTICDLFDQESYRQMLSLADEVIYLQDAYTSTCLNDRNHRMVDASNITLGIYKYGESFSAKGGTAECLRYTEKQGKHIFLLNPMDTVSKEDMQKCVGLKEYVSKSSGDDYVYPSCLNI